jgi:hypothetical protein
MRKKFLTKDQRQIQIQQWFAARIQDHNDNSIASLAQIAQGVKMSPSSHLRSICESMVDSDVLVAKELVRNGRWIGRGYRLAKGAYSRPATRNVTIKFTLKGKQYTEEFLL